MTEQVTERSTTLDPEPQAPAVARRLLAEVLRETRREEWLDAAELALSELATNVVLHAHTPLTVRIRCSDSELRVEVEDLNHLVPSQRAYGAEATTGRGLALVAAITSGHGVTRTPTGKVVWFCLTGPVVEQELDAQGIESLLDAWDDEDAPAEPRAAGQVVQLLGFPPTLWLAGSEVHDGLLRELSLYRSGRALPSEDLAAADRARFSLRSVVQDVVHRAADEGHASDPLPAGHPSRLLAPVAPRIDVDLSLWEEAPADFAALQDVLDEANRLAVKGELLVSPALPEVIACRDWVAEQVISGSVGQPPLPWPGADAPQFVEERDQAVRELDYDVASAVGGTRTAIVVDAQNRIAAISTALADEIGWDVDQLVGRRVVAIVPARYREAHVAGLTRHLTTGEAHALRVELQLPVLRADGSEVLCDFWIDADQTRNGHPVYIAYVSPVEVGAAR